jgi:hypothetical protein
MHDMKLTKSNLLSYEVDIQLDMLSPSMMNWIRR